jgi:hypothetical protein
MFKGQAFDGFMSKLSGNHIALVDSPRITNAFVGDAAPARTPFESAARYAPGLRKINIGPVYF